MSTLFTEITQCRSCHSNHLETVLNLGSLAISDFPLLGEPEESAPLELVYCYDCSLVQLRHTVDRDHLYRTNYWYISGVNESMVEALRDIVRYARDQVELDDGDTVLDIGCNDGTLLAEYPPELHRIGFEPCLDLGVKALKRADKIVVSYFPPDSTYRKEFTDQPKIITSIAQFYNVDDPADYVATISDWLHPDGIWIVQMQGLSDMVDHNGFDNICLPESDPVITSSGCKPIGKITKDERVLTHQGRYVQVKSTFRRHYTGDIIEIRSYGSGYTLRVTPEHPVMVLQDDTWNWVAAKDITKGNLVGRPIPRSGLSSIYIDSPPKGTHRPDSTVKSIPVNDDLLCVAGYYLAEGFVNNANGAVHFSFGKSQDELSLVSECSEHLKSLGFSANISQNKTSTIVTSYGAIGRLLENEFGHGAANKRVPYWVMELSSERAKKILDCYIAGDGYEYRKSYLRASTVSENLALGISMLANKCGYTCSISRCIKPQTHNIQGREVNQKPVWDILIATNRKLREKCWLQGNFQVSRVKSVTTSYYSGIVCNLEVGDEGTYVSPAMVVHNCHEHLTYWDHTAFTRLLARYDLKVTNVSRNKVNGGSVRYTIKHGQPEYLLDPVYPYHLQAFARRVESLKEQTIDLLQSLRNQGKVVFGYAASTKGNTLLQYYGIDTRYIQAIAERSTSKWGKVTAGTHIPICSEATMRAIHPDYLFCLAWGFADSFLSREFDYILAGGRFIVPLPELRIVGTDGDAKIDPVTGVPGASI